MKTTRAATNPAFYWNREPHPHAGKQQPLICETCAIEQIRALEAELAEMPERMNLIWQPIFDRMKARAEKAEGELAERKDQHAYDKARAEKAEARVAELEDRLDKLVTGDFDGDVAEFAAKVFEAREKEG